MANPWEQNWSASAPPAESAPAEPWNQNWSAPKKEDPPILEQLGQLWPARLVKSMYEAAKLPGEVYQGKTQVDPSNPEFMGRVLDLATIATPMAPKVGATIKAVGPAAAPTTEALHEAATQGYNAARSSPLTIDAAAVGNLARNIQTGLEQKGILKEFAPDTHAVLSHIQSAEPGAIATGGNLVSIREALRQASQNFSNPREAKAANEAIAELDRFIATPPAEAVLAGAPSEFAATIEGARGNYAAAKRSELVQNELETARRNAAVANSGHNVGNAERQRFNAITKSDKKSAGFSDEELAQMDRIIFGTPTGNTLRTAGNMLGGGGGVAAPVVAGIGATFNPWLAAAPVAGWAMKKGSDAITARNIRQLDEMVRSRSPLAQESAGAIGLSPAQEAGRTLLIRSLMNPSLSNYQQQPNQSDLIQALQGWQK